MFSPFVSQSNFTIGINQFAVGADSLRSEIVIKRVAPGAPTANAKLYAGLVEDTVFGNGGNGETQHYNVLRRSLYSAQGQSVDLPLNVGDSIILSKTENFNAIWNSSRIRTVAILQDSASKQVIQSELSTTLQIGASTSIKSYICSNSISIYPNPANQYITLSSNDTKLCNYEITNGFGQIVLNGKTGNQQSINISSLVSGIYYLKFFDEAIISRHKIIVRN
jgi:hypothetical protein